MVPLETDDISFNFSNLRVWGIAKNPTKRESCAEEEIPNEIFCFLFLLLDKAGGGGAGVIKKTWYF